MSIGNILFQFNNGLPFKIGQSMALLLQFPLLLVYSCLALKQWPMTGFELKRPLSLLRHKRSPELQTNDYEFSD